MFFSFFDMRVKNFVHRLLFPGKDGGILQTLLYSGLLSVRLFLLLSLLLLRFKGFSARPKRYIFLDILRCKGILDIVKVSAGYFTSVQWGQTCCSHDCLGNPQKVSILV